MNTYKKLKKQISIGLMALLVFSIATQPVFANENTKKNALEYYEIDGQQYGFERIVDKDNNKINTNIYLNGKLTDEVVVDFANEIITSNGEEVGFLKEVLEEVPTSELNNKITSVSEPNNMITSVVDPGGGGIKTYIRTYTTGFTSVTRQVVLAVFSSLAVAASVAIAAYFGVKLDNGTLLAGIGAFIDGNLNLLLPDVTYYVKVYDTGIVYNYGSEYRRALLEVYSDSSCSWTTYKGCEWADSYIVK